jgi:hypothetical protein
MMPSDAIQPIWENPWKSVIESAPKPQAVVRPATNSDTHSSCTLAFAHQEVNAEVDRHACEDGERGGADDVDFGFDENDESDGDGQTAQHGDHELHDRRQVTKEHQHHEQRA